MSNDARPGTGSGDPTEIALVEYAARHGAQRDALEAAAPRVFEVPFSAERKRMSTVHATEGTLWLREGAPEAVLPACTRALRGGAEPPLDRAAVTRVADAMAAAGLRVLAVGRRGWSMQPVGEDDALETDLCLLGLVGLLDPPRKEARRQSKPACMPASYP